ncbi:glycosyltransferase family 4 protein [Lacinutrix undariae]
MKTVFVHHRSKHHAVNSGYSKLLDYYPNHIVVRGAPTIPYSLAKMAAKMSHQNAGLYNAGSVFKEIELYKTLRKLSANKSLVHYLNGERDIRYLMHSKPFLKGATFCATFHKPPTVLNTLITNDTYIKRLDGAVVVGAQQVDYVKERFKIENVAYIPHGVDTSFFKPKSRAEISPVLLFVGQHLRDFETFNTCVPILASKIKDLKIQVVIREDFLKYITPHSSLQLFSDLNDVQLRTKYQDASALFLPLLDSTACNSILEAIACGLPVITTDVGGNSVYLEGTGTCLATPYDIDNLIAITLSVLKEESKLKALGEAVRQKSLTYDWRIISDHIQKFHNLIRTDK